MNGKMQISIFRLIIIALFLSLPIHGRAQENDSTLAGLAAALRTAMRLASFAESHPELYARASQALSRIENSAVTLQEAAALTGKPGLNALSRLHQRRFDFNAAGFVSADSLEADLQLLKSVANNELTEALDEKLDESTTDALLQPVTQLQEAQLQISLNESIERLRRYERKFGPGSAPLNGPEILLNYLLQRAPGFGPHANGPGPLEAVLSYSSAYLTFKNQEPAAVSILEIGLRHYNFGAGWGGSGFAGYLKPGYFTFGLAIAGEKDGAFTWPFRGKERLGAFFSWGDIKVAYLGGNDSRWLLSRQFQFVPLIF